MKMDAPDSFLGDIGCILLSASKVLVAILTNQGTFNEVDTPACKYIFFLFEQSIVSG